MWLMDKLIGSDLCLKRPDFETAPTQSLDFSGNKLIFKDPPHTSMFPIHDWPEDMDIYNTANLNKQKEGGYAKRFYVKGWELYGKLNKTIGEVKVSAVLTYDNNNDKSYFEKSVFEEQVFLFSHNRWGFQNDSEKLGDLGTGLYGYPVSSSDLEYVDINNIRWCHFKGQAKGKTPDVIYATAISDSHILFVNCVISAFKSIDFYSPKTNIEQASFKVIEDFMKNFNLELSDKSKLQKREAKDPA